MQWEENSSTSSCCGLEKSPSKSETKCLLFIVEMDVICAQNISICEWASDWVCVFVFWSLKSFRRADWIGDKKRIICFLFTVKCLDCDARIFVHAHTNTPYNRTKKESISFSSKASFLFSSFSRSLLFCSLSLFFRLPMSLHRV